MIDCWKQKFLNYLPQNYVCLIALFDEDSRMCQHGIRLNNLLIYTHLVDRRLLLVFCESRNNRTLNEISEEEQ